MLITNQLLYQLSYASKIRRRTQNKFISDADNRDSIYF